MANVAFNHKAPGPAKRRASAAEEFAPERGKERAPSVSGEKIDRTYAEFRRSDAKLLNAKGDARRLPASPHSFLTELLAQLSRNKSVTIVRNQAALTTAEAANVLGVSRQFLVNLLERGEIEHHTVGTHRRVYAQDLLRYKAARDKGRHKLLRDLSVAEAAEGLYERIPVRAARMRPSKPDAP